MLTINFYILARFLLIQVCELIVTPFCHGAIIVFEAISVREPSVSESHYCQGYPEVSHPLYPVEYYIN